MATVKAPRKTARADNGHTPSPAEAARAENNRLPDPLPVWMKPAASPSMASYADLPDTLSVVIDGRAYVAVLNRDREGHGNGLPSYKLSDKLHIGAHKLQLGLNVTVCRPKS